MCKSRYRQCSESEFKCDNNRCISSNYKCDNDNDCGDNSDEAEEICNPTIKGGSQSHNSSEITSTTPTPVLSNFCDNEKEFTCNNTKCIPKEHYCDLEDDCGDQSDEPNNLCRIRSCPNGWRK